MIALWTFLALLISPPSGETGNLSAEEIAPHKFHVSYARVAVEGAVAVARVRFFKDDLGTTLAAASGATSEALVVTPAQDSLFQAYFNEQFVFVADEIPLAGNIIGSGEEVLGQESMWWYMMEFEASSPIEHLQLTNTLLFGEFEDQKNIVQIQHFPSEASWSLYFVDDAHSFELDFKSD